MCATTILNNALAVFQEYQVTYRAVVRARTVITLAFLAVPAPVLLDCWRASQGW